MTPRKIVISLNSAWNLFNFRAGLIRALSADGHEVVAMAPTDDYAARLPELGCRFVPIPMNTTGTNPLQDLKVLHAYWQRLREERPDVYLGFTIKPNIYGSLAARHLKIPTINNIAGLGKAFHARNWLAFVVSQLYRTALGPATKVLFQNEEDRAAFISQGITSAQVSMRIPGSGVNLERFDLAPVGPRQDGQPFRFLLAARLLWEKGVREYVEAARALRDQGVHVECAIVGFPCTDARAGATRAQLNEWAQEGIIQYLGISDRIEDELAAADCVVLPSYYLEGVPRILLEASAARRPIITTDWTGCRDAVEHLGNGLLCQPRDVEALTRTMVQMARMPLSTRQDMGQRGRDKAIEAFSEARVIDIYRGLIAQVPAR